MVVVCMGGCVMWLWCVWVGMLCGCGVYGWLCDVAVVCMGWRVVWLWCVWVVV